MFTIIYRTVTEHLVVEVESVSLSPSLIIVNLLPFVGLISRIQMANIIQRAKECVIKVPCVFNHITRQATCKGTKTGYIFTHCIAML